MATEKDVYELSTEQAAAALKALVPELDNVKVKIKDTNEEAAKSTSQFKEFSDLIGKDLKNSFFSAQAQYDLVKSSLTALAHGAVEASQEFLKAEQASLRLGVALHNAGGSSFKQALDEQASALQRLTGIEDEQITAVQTMLASMGVAPELIERTTKAAINLSVATGSLESAARLLARTEGQGSEDLKKYNLSVDETIPKQERFVALLAETEKQYAGLIDQQPQILKQTNELKGAWRDLVEAIGSRLVNTVGGGMSQTGQGIIATVLFGPFSEFASQVREGKEHLLSLAEVMDFWAEKIKVTTKEAKQGQIELLTFANLKKMGEDAHKEGDGNVDFMHDEEANAAKTAIKARTEAELASDAAKYKAAQERKTREEIDAENQRYNNERNASRLRLKESDDLDILETLGFAQPNDLKMRMAQERLVVEEHQKFQQAIAEHDRALILKEEQQKAEQLQKDKIFWDGMRQNFEGYAETIVGSWASYFGQLLTQDTKFTREMKELTLERETLGMSETEAKEKRLSIEKQLADEQGAAFLKTTADALASIAQQAAIKAVFEAAEAVRSAANYDEYGAVQHGIAAGIYAGIAVSAGAGAAGISGARGVTTEERQQLEAAKQSEETQKQDRLTREKKQESQREAEQGANIVVYNIGISGKTEVEQGKELERIQKQFSNLRTGG